MTDPSARGPVARGEGEVEHVELIGRAIEMRRGNQTYQAIADELGVCRQTASRLVKRGFKMMLDENGAEELRAKEMMLLEDLTQRLLPVLFPEPRQMMETMLDDDGEPMKDAKGNTLMVPQWNDDLSPRMYTPLPDFDAIDKYLKIHNAKMEAVGARVDKKIHVAVERDEEDKARAEYIAERLDRFMDLADRVANGGYGSGRMDPAELEAAREAEEGEMREGAGSLTIPDDDIEDAVIIEDIPVGDWVDGQFVPRES